MGLPLAAETALPDGACFAPEGTHCYMFQVGAGETRIEVLIAVVPEAGTCRYWQRFGAGLRHRGDACDDVARLRARGMGRSTSATPGRRYRLAAFFHPKTAGGILTELVPAR